MKTIASIIVFFFYFSVLWKITGEIWERVVPLTWKTNLIALLVVPILIMAAYLFSSLTIKWTVNGRN
ncbi:hypothetical protein [Halobacillus kuroshimensis]|uniref:hypothetical protein n=1 Tax=Halobacillus kuroshimensis TaxID=302481 RepID=UPI00041615F6|nr:hypothetical protein [Halobacillus kuroshimensis]